MDRKPRCPTCKKEIEKTPFFPFCSERCKLVDLGRWIGEEFRIPAEDTSSEPEPKDDKKIVH